MSSTPISVKAATEQGIKTIKTPARQILAIVSALVILTWVFLGFTWWTLLFIPLSIMIATRVANHARAQWRLWAYSNVTDIHQLQRSAELAELLPIGSHEQVGDGLMFYQRKEMAILLGRFSQDVGFIDDPAIPDKTDIYERPFVPIDGKVVLSIDSFGINVYGTETYGWQEIINERIANVGFKKKHRYDGSYVSGGTMRYFRFNCGSKQFEFKMEDIKISAWELDLITYIYRGRWAANHDTSLAPELAQRSGV